MDPRPWLSHDFFKQANEAFNSPSRMPQRPILQITKLDAIKVRYSEKDIKTIRYYSVPFQALTTDLCAQTEA